LNASPFLGHHDLKVVSICLDAIGASMLMQDGKMSGARVVHGQQ
jgi:hypothetical protein